MKKEENYLRMSSSQSSPRPRFFLFKAIPYARMGKCDECRKDTCDICTPYYQLLILEGYDVTICLNMLHLWFAKDMVYKFLGEYDEKPEGDYDGYTLECYNKFLEELSITDVSSAVEIDPLGDLEAILKF